MDNKKKNNFLFMEDWFNLIEPMTDISMGKVVRTMCKKIFRGEDYDPKSFEPMEQMALGFIIPKMQEARLNYEAKCQKYRENANKRYGKQSNAIATNGKQSNAIAEEREREREKEIEREIEKEKEEEREMEGVGAIAPVSSSSLSDDKKLISSIVHNENLRELMIKWSDVLVEIGANTSIVPEYTKLMKMSANNPKKAAQIVQCAIDRKWMHINPLPKSYAAKRDIGRIVQNKDKDMTAGLDKLK